MSSSLDPRDIGEKLAQCSRRVQARGLERLAPAKDDSAVFEQRQSNRSKLWIGVAPSDLVVGHNAEADQIAQRRAIARVEIPTREKYRHAACLLRAGPATFELRAGTGGGVLWRGRLRRRDCPCAHPACDRSE